MESMKKPAIRFKGFTEDWEQRKLEISASLLEEPLQRGFKYYLLM